MRENSIQSRSCKYVGIALLLLCALPVMAQETLQGRIFYAEGTEFSITSNGNRRTYRTENLNADGIALNWGDLIQTGPDNYVEIRFSPGGTVIKLAENTSFLLSGLDTVLQRVNLSLLYGRLRVLTGQGTGNRNFLIRMENTAAMVREGDIGLDYILQPVSGQGVDSRPKVQVYGFAGTVEITLTPAGGSGGASSIPGITVKENEAVSLEAQSPLSVIERKPLGTDIVRYWERHAIQSSEGAQDIEQDEEPPLLAGGEEFPAESDTPKQEKYDEYTPVGSGPQFRFTQTPAPNRRLLAKNITLVSGSFLFLTGAVIQGMGYFSLRDGDTSAAEKFMSIGYIPLGLGLGAIIASIFINPAQR